MRSKMLRITMLAWTCWWFVLFVPGHQRGMVRTDGKSDGGCPMCMLANMPGCEPASDASRSGKPTGPWRDPVEHCAICFLAAHIDLPPTIDLTPPPCGLCDLLQAQSVARPPILFMSRAHPGRAPPIAPVI